MNETCIGIPQKNRPTHTHPDPNYAALPEQMAPLFLVNPAEAAAPS